jgi:hypothetical protein
MLSLVNARRAVTRYLAWMGRANQGQCESAIVAADSNSSTACDALKQW